MEHPAETMMNVSAGVSIGTALLTWFDNNAEAIGGIVAVATFIAYIIFSIINVKINQQRLEFDRRNAKKADK